MAVKVLYHNPVVSADLPRRRAEFDWQLAGIATPDGRCQIPMERTVVRRKLKSGAQGLQGNGYTCYLPGIINDAFRSAAEDAVGDSGGIWALTSLAAGRSSKSLMHPGRQASSETLQEQTASPTGSRKPVAATSSPADYPPGCGRT